MERATFQDVDWKKLSKKERKKLAKDLRKRESQSISKKAGIQKWAIIAAVILLLILGRALFAKNVGKEVSKPLPGQAVSLLGRTHVPVGTKVRYNSNPPTSGDHYPEPAKSGVYDKPIEDGYLVHSLEHGYVIVSYNCSLGSQNPNKGCLNFVEKLKERLKGDSWKLILIPRPSLDTNFALTAWGRIDKFNINKANMQRVDGFINAFRDQGPEKTPI